MSVHISANVINGLDGGNILKNRRIVVILRPVAPYFCILILDMISLHASSIFHESAGDRLSVHHHHHGLRMSHKSGFPQKSGNSAHGGVTLVNIGSLFQSKPLFLIRIAIPRLHHSTQTGAELIHKIQKILPPGEFITHLLRKLQIL